MNISKCAVEKKIEDRALGNVFCFLKLRDNRSILCGCDKGTFCFYDMKTVQYTLTGNNHNSNITDLLIIDNNTFLSSSDDITIKEWKY